VIGSELDRPYPSEWVGRYHELELHSFSFEEFCAHPMAPSSIPISEKFLLYMKWGGLPYIVSHLWSNVGIVTRNDTALEGYLNGLFNWVATKVGLSESKLIEVLEKGQNQNQQQLSSLAVDKLVGMRFLLSDDHRLYCIDPGFVSYEFGVKNRSLELDMHVRTIVYPFLRDLSKRRGKILFHRDPFDFVLNGSLCCAVCHSRIGRLLTNIMQWLLRVEETVKDAQKPVICLITHGCDPLFKYTLTRPETFLLKQQFVNICPQILMEIKIQFAENSKLRNVHGYHRVPSFKFAAFRVFWIPIVSSCCPALCVCPDIIDLIVELLLQHSGIDYYLGY